MALGVADHVWTIGELLDAALATPQRRLLALNDAPHFGR